MHAGFSLATRRLRPSAGQPAERSRSIQPRKPPSARCVFERRGRRPLPALRTIPGRPCAGSAPSQGRAWRQIAVGGPASRLRHQGVAAPLRDQARHLGRRIGQIAEVPGAGRAGGHARGDRVFQVLVVDAVDAQGALLHHPGRGVELARAVGTRPRAELAADAAVLIDEHDPVLLALVRGPGGADGHARRVLAMEWRQDFGKCTTRGVSPGASTS